MRVELGERGYDIRIGPRLLGDEASYRLLRSRVLRIVTDEHVAPLYLEPLLKALGVGPEEALVLPAGEQQKTWANAERVLDWLLAARLPRDGVLVALGGGVIGDLAGFCAALYQRGIDFVQIPTTLLAQVDSSVGGKTGVNHARGKNMIGAFHQPRAVIADTDTLRSLPPRELAAGIAEVIKCGMLGDSSLFARLERDLEHLLALDAEALADAIEAEVADIGLGGDEGHRYAVAHLALSQLGIDDHGEFIGRAEAGGALHRADHHRLRIGGQLVKDGACGHGVINLTDRLRKAGMRPQPLDLVKGQFRTGGDDQIVVGQGFAGRQLQGIIRRIDARGAFRVKNDALLLEDGTQIDLDCLALAPAHRHPRIGWYELIGMAFVDDDDLGLVADGFPDLEGGDGAAKPRAQNDDAWCLAGSHGTLSS